MKSIQLQKQKLEETEEIKIGDIELERITKESTIKGRTPKNVKKPEFSKSEIVRYKER